MSHQTRGDAAPFTAADLLDSTDPGALAPNACFAPSPEAGPAHAPFEGSLRLAEAPMTLDPPLARDRVLGKDPARFPAVSLRFFTERDRLVPATQDLLRVGSRPGGESYWDVLVQPGRVWSEPDDGPWSRASFPFALVHDVEGETHTGIALFLYDGERVSPLRFQVVQQTLPYNVRPPFVAWGAAAATFSPGIVADLPRLRTAWRAECAGRLPSADRAELERLVGVEALAGIDEPFPAGDVLTVALLRDGTLYRRACATAAGPFPYTDEMRFGVWSVAKSAANAVALFRLAEKHGPGIVDEPIAAYLPEAAASPSWSAVTFGHLAHMTSGHGCGSLVTEPNDMFSGYEEGGAGLSYADWYTAPSKAQKLAGALAQPAFPWAPGTVVRYRDQDAWLLGLALDAYLKRREDPSADLWEMVRDEVYRPIGIAHAPMNRTIEPDGSPGQPLMAYGYYPTLQDLARIAMLLMNGGAWDGEQLLHRGLVEQVLPGPEPRGLADGTVYAAGAERYSFTYYLTSFTPAGGAPTYVSAMHGWGGNLVLLLPDGTVALRMARHVEEQLGVDTTTPVAAACERLGAFRDAR